MIADVGDLLVEVVVRFDEVDVDVFEDEKAAVADADQRRQFGPVRFREDGGDLLFRSRLDLRDDQSAFDHLAFSPPRRSVVCQPGRGRMRVRKAFEGRAVEVEVPDVGTVRARRLERGRR